MSGAKSWGDSRTKVFDTLIASDEALSVPVVAARCRLHPNTARFHLDRLVQTGQVRRTTDEQHRPGRPTMMYAVVESMADEADGYRFLAEILAGSVAAGSAAPADHGRRAGAKAGARLARSAEAAMDSSAADAKSELVGMLEDTGFAPELVSVDGKDQIDLHRCPFAAVVPEHGEVVCAVHLGLMQGMLDTFDAGIQVPRLDPHVEPTRCVAYLSHRTASTQPEDDDAS